jgi:hypothetical protein
MSDPATSTPPPAAPPPAAPPPAAPSPGPLDNLIASMGLPTLLVVGGAALLVLMDLVFGVILREYWLDTVIWVAAALVLVVFFVARRGMQLPVSTSSLMIFLGAVIGVAGARELLASALSIVQRPGAWDGPDLIAFAGYAIGVVAVAVGAWQLWRGGRSATG